MYLPEPGYKRIIVVTFYVILAAAAIFVFFKYLFVGLLPFFIGWFFAFLIQKPLHALQRLKIPKKLTSIIFVLIAISVIAALIVLIVGAVVSEFNEAFSKLSSLVSNNPDYPEKITQWLENVLIDIPFINARELVISFSENINSLLVSAVKALTPYIPTVITPIVTFVPYFIIFVIVTVISACYFSIDYDKIKAFFKLQLSEKKLGFARAVKKQLLSTTFKYLRAYLMLILITFTELFVGFKIIGIEYALILAIIIALIDILPVLGTGTVLIPWGVVMLLQRDYRMGISLLVLYAVITVIRQIIEPKIVGGFIGLYPLLVLASMYLGAKLLGIAGIFVFPIVIMVIKSLNENGIIKLYKNPQSNTKK